MMARSDCLGLYDSAGDHMNESLVAVLLYYYLLFLCLIDLLDGPQTATKPITLGSY